MRDDNAACFLRFVGPCPGYDRPLYHSWWLAANQTSTLNCLQRQLTWQATCGKTSVVEYRVGHSLSLPRVEQKQAAPGRISAMRSTRPPSPLPGPPSSPPPSLPPLPPLPPSLPPSALLDVSAKLLPALCDSFAAVCEQQLPRNVRLAHLAHLRQKLSRQLHFATCATTLDDGDGLHHGSCLARGAGLTEHPPWDKRFPAGCFAHADGFRMLLAEEHLRRSLQRPHAPEVVDSIDVIVSLVGMSSKLPEWLTPLNKLPSRFKQAHSKRLKEPRVNANVTVVAYMKVSHFNSTKPIEVDRGNGFATRLVQFNPRLRNVYIYLLHIVENYDELADMTVFLKTNVLDGQSATEEDVANIIHTAASGHYLFNSHPWLRMPGRRRFLKIKCDERWKWHWLYPLLCPCRTYFPLTRSLGRHEGLYIDCPSSLNYLRAEVQHSTIEELFPLVTEGYFEGMYTVHRSLIHQRPRSYYANMLRKMEVEGESHDEANVMFGLYLFDDRSQDARAVDAWKAPRSLALYPGTFDMRPEKHGSRRNVSHCWLNPPNGQGAWL